MNLDKCSGHASGIHMIRFDEHSMYCGNCNMRVLLASLRCWRCGKVLDRFTEQQLKHIGAEDKFQCDECGAFTTIKESKIN